MICDDCGRFFTEGYECGSCNVQLCKECVDINDKECTFCDGADGKLEETVNNQYGSKWPNNPR